MEVDDLDLAEGDLALPKPSTKRKPPKVEENCSKKEHVNVVFIGHVGESKKVLCAIFRVSFQLSICRCWKIYNRRSNNVTNWNG